MPTLQGKELPTSKRDPLAWRQLGVMATTWGCPRRAFPATAIIARPDRNASSSCSCCSTETAPPVSPQLDKIQASITRISLELREMRKIRGPSDSEIDSSTGDDRITLEDRMKTLEQELMREQEYNERNIKDVLQFRINLLEMKQGLKLLEDRYERLEEKLNVATEVLERICPQSPTRLEDNEELKELMSEIINSRMSVELKKLQTRLDAFEASLQGGLGDIKRLSEQLSINVSLGRTNIEQSRTHLEESQRDIQRLVKTVTGLREKIANVEFDLRRIWISRLDTPTDRLVRELEGKVNALAIEISRLAAKEGPKLFDPVGRRPTPELEHPEIGGSPNRLPHQEISSSSSDGEVLTGSSGDSPATGASIYRIGTPPLK